jgi:hypothetical protein
MYVVILDPSRSLVVHHILNTHYVVLPQYVNIYDTLWPMSVAHPGVINKDSVTDEDNSKNANGCFADGVACKSPKDCCESIYYLVWYMRQILVLLISYHHMIIVLRLSRLRLLPNVNGNVFSYGTSSWHQRRLLQCCEWRRQLWKRNWSAVSHLVALYDTWDFIFIISYHHDYT